MKRHTIVSLLVLFLIFVSVRTEPTLAFVNGQIITMDSNSRVAEAMLVKGGRISELGTTNEIRGKITTSVQVIDLLGRTVIPGFVDAHSHFPSSGMRAVSVDLSPPPTGTTGSLQNLLSKIGQSAQNSSSSEWLLGFNYDNTVLFNGLHPTRTQLDEVAPNHPVYLWHNSGHMGVANSRALELLSIDKNSVAPPGGVFGRDRQSGELNGLLQETAAPPLATIVRRFSWRKQLRVLTSARDTYLAQGVTTVQNGYTGLNMMRVLKMANLIGLIPQRVIVWPAHGKKSIEKKFIDAPAGKTLHSEQDDFDYRVGAIKVLVDGSPQGLTAYLSEPYFKTKSRPKSYRGFPLLDQQKLTSLVTRYHANGYQLALHGNGDQAIEFIINSVEAAQSEHPRPDARHIIVHAQTIRRDQLARLEALGLSPSFFNSHTYYWGDWHRNESLGPDRAANISPAGWASELGLRYSFHTDAPVTPMNPWQLVWSAIHRKSISGVELGPAQRVDVDSALRAITIDAAWQNFVDHKVGSLEAGKMADLAVLSDDPYVIDDVRKIQVLATYIGGVEHFSSAGQITDELTSEHEGD